MRLSKLKLPYRAVFGLLELHAVFKVFVRKWLLRQDFGFQGYYEDKLTSRFSKTVGLRYSDAVNSGSTAIWISLKSIGLQNADEVIVSPITNPGSVMPVSLIGASIRVADSEPGCFNMSLGSVQKLINHRTKCIIVTHLAGLPCEDIESIAAICKENYISLIEDCSQAHGSCLHGRPLGSFGDISVWSTMFSKLLATGGCGGIISTSSYELYCNIRSYSDRGKHFENADFDGRDSHLYKYPSLNFNQSEPSCAIGLSVLARLPRSISRRSEFACELSSSMIRLGCTGQVLISSCEPTSYFYLIIQYPPWWFLRYGAPFTSALESFGLKINPRNREVVSEWNWLINELVDSTPNAIAARDSSFNLLFNERYTRRHARKIASVIFYCENSANSPG